MKMNPILKIDDLEKSYKDKKVIHGISFAVEPGEILCLLGPNGAGKSTTINILNGALGHDAGSIAYKGRALGKSERAFKKNLGIVPQDLALYEDLSAARNVRFFCSLYGIRGKELDEKTAAALRFAGLVDRANDKVKTFSGGMKRRLNIACAIAHDPELVIMDEPTVGIDPQSRNHILDSIRDLRAKGKTIIYTTHYMEEVEEISTRILIMDHGKIIAGGTKEEIKSLIAGVRELCVDFDAETPVPDGDFLAIEGVRSVTATKGGVKITSVAEREILDKVIAVLMGAKAKISNIASREASLETVFLALTGATLRD
jgi:ABC-2 type transport system ATP-binding protein